VESLFTPVLTQLRKGKLARLLAKYDNPECAEAIWGTNEEGQTWRYMYFLTEPIKIYQPVYEYEGYLHSRYQGFTRIPDARLEEIEGDYGSIEEFIKEILQHEDDGLPGSLQPGTSRSRNIAPETYLLIWNPNRWTWEERDVRRDIAQLEVSGRIEGFRWSVGTNYRRIEAGDRLFLIRLGSEPRGIFLSGTAKGHAFRAAHGIRVRRNGHGMWISMWISC